MTPAAGALVAQQMSVRQRLTDYLALTKPRVVLMVLITTFVGYYLGSRNALEALPLLHTLIGTALAAGGTMALNQFMERARDSQMVRTRHRPLPEGRLLPVEALVFGSALTVVGLAYLLWTVGPLAAGLTTTISATYLLLYTPLKTVTSLCSLVGAVPGALPPVMGWAAARGSLEAGAWILFLILFFWQLPHFLALAWMYREDYARAGFPMLPVEEPTGASTGRQVVLQTLALLVVSLLPLAFEMAGEGYLVAALVLGAGFLGFGVAFAAERSRDRASRLFLASIAYLPLLLGALALL